MDRYKLEAYKGYDESKGSSLFRILLGVTIIIVVAVWFNTGFHERLTEFSNDIQIHNALKYDKGDK